MVRRKVEIKKIEDKARRHTTFTKRRQGLFKKANELCSKSGDEVAIITFSLANNMYALGNPNVGTVVRRYLEHDHHHADVEEEETEEEDDDDDNEVVVKEEEDGDLEELDRLEAEVEEMVKKVRDVAKHMLNKM